MREFLIRFRHLMPSVRGDNNRQRQIIAATEDVLGFWRNDGEVGQRAVLAALLELVQGEEDRVIVEGEDASVAAVKRARKEAHASSFTSHGDAISRPWETMKKVIEDEGLWKHPEDSWAIQRGVEDEGSREKRSGRIKVQVDERLRVLEGLMGISFRTQQVRSDMLDVSSGKPLPIEARWRAGPNAPSDCADVAVFDPYLSPNHPLNPSTNQPDRLRLFRYV